MPKLHTITITFLDEDLTALYKIIDGAANGYRFDILDEVTFNRAWRLYNNIKVATKTNE